MAAFACAHRAHVGAPSHASWLHRGYTEGPSGCVRMRTLHHFRHTPTRMMASSGAPPKASVAALACARRAHLSTSPTRFAAPQ
eukprot:2672485-Pyramimonas_sp.AAC.1